MPTAERQLRHLIAAGLAAAVVTGVLGSAAAQEGFYDRWGNWVALPPPQVLRRLPPSDVGPPPIYRRVEPAPPQGYRYVDPPQGYRYAEPPQGYRYAEPPPVYRYAEPPPVYRSVEPGWAGLPPRDIPPAPALRRLPGGRVIAVPPQDYAIEADPDASARDDRDGWGLSPDDPYFRQAEPRLVPPTDLQRDEPRRRGHGQAIAALARYAPAKRAAVALSDDFERLEAIRRVNAYLVANAVEPANAATIRAIDTILGIPTTPDSTALPGAGTDIATPGTGTGDDAADARRRLAGYADAKADALAARDDDGRVRAIGTALERLGDAAADLDDEEIAGLDAYLGLDTTALLAGRTTEQRAIR